MTDRRPHAVSGSGADTHPGSASQVTAPATAPRRYQAPYERLFIYYLEGLAGADEIDFGSRFIGNWEEDGYSFLFFSSPAADDVRRLAAARPDLKLLDQYEMTYDDWQGGRFQGLRAGRLVIRPPWAEGPASTAAEADDIEVMLDPGVVFGAGTHATTRDCLAALEILSSEKTDGTLLDLGTGTGVLAVAAGRLGWRHPQHGSPASRPRPADAAPAPGRRSQASCAAPAALAPRGWPDTGNGRRAALIPAARPSGT